MIDTTEFLVHARLEAEALDAWIEAGWLLPRRDGDVCRLSEIDLARARLIRDLKEDLGVNDEGTALILDLVDQIHGLRRALRELASAVHRQPEEVRRWIVADIREAASNRTGTDSDDTGQPHSA